MTRLANTILELVQNGLWTVSVHAQNKLDERKVADWQVAAATDDGDLLVERPGGRPNPVIELDIALADGTPCKAVWALLPHGEAKLVTVHFYR